MLQFDIPWKHQKTIVFLTFSGVIEMEHWLDMDKSDHFAAANIHICFKNVTNHESYYFVICIRFSG